MKDRLVPNSDFYRIQEPVSLERECAERFIQILNNFPVQHTAMLPNQNQYYYVSQTLEPEVEQLASQVESIPSLRIAQTLAVTASADLNLKSGDKGNLSTASEEYHVLSLETGDYSQDYDDTSEQMEDFNLEWRGEIAVIIKPTNEDDELEIHIVNQQTGDNLTTDEMLELLSLLSAWQEEQRYNALIHDLRNPPTITAQLDNRPIANLSATFMPDDYISHLSCTKCSINLIPCTHSGFRHNAN